jgi:hypothetical protein
MASDMYNAFPVCDSHMASLESRLHDRIHFYLTTNTPVSGYYTLCSGLDQTGGQCENPATHKAEAK